MTEGWRGGPDMHVSVFIQDEMDARGWSRDLMSVSMARSGDLSFGVCRLMLDLVLDVGPDHSNLRLGGMAREVAAAFGTSEVFWRNIERSWLEAQPKSGE